MKRLVGLVALAFVLSIFAGVGALHIQNQANTRALKSLGTEKVYVATRDIPTQTSLSKALAIGAISLQDFPTKFLSLDSIASLNSALSNELSLAPIRAGQVLYQSEFAPRIVVPQAASGFAPPPGMWALSFDIPVANRVGGYLKPGDVVNVLYTGAIGNGAVTTRTLDTGVTILAIGRNSINGLAPSDPNSANSDLITLSVSPSVAPSLLTSAKSGTLSLVLISSSKQVTTP